MLFAFQFSVLFYTCYFNGQQWLFKKMGGISFSKNGADLLEHFWTGWFLTLASCKCRYRSCKCRYRIAARRGAARMRRRVARAWRHWLCMISYNVWFTSSKRASSSLGEAVINLTIIQEAFALNHCV